MKKKIFMLAVILLATAAASKAKAVSREEYCDTLAGIIACYVLQDEEVEEYEMSRSYGVFDAWHEHCHEHCMTRTADKK